MTSPQSTKEKAMMDEERVRRVEILISQLLRLGIAASLALIAAGTFMSFLHHPDYLSSSDALLRLTKPGAAFPHTWHDVAAGLSALHGQSIVIIGLLLLIATPVIRVAVSILGFVYQGDRVFTLITTIVLCLLLLSFALGKVE